MAQKPREALRFDPSQAAQLQPYLPISKPLMPFTTLTFATSLDSQISLAPGVQTALSGPESKAMTHYLRSKHDVILIGVGTAVADDPSLNCRIEGVGGYGGEGLEGQPQPVVVDPKGRWEVSSASKVVRLAKEGKGKAPWVVTRKGYDAEKRRVLEDVGGRILEIEEVDSYGGNLLWEKILGSLGTQGVRSVMIEGGGKVINDLLSPQWIRFVDSVIVTIAPVWLGQGGVQVCPDERVENEVKVAVSRLGYVKWLPLGEDVVLCGRPKQ